MTRAERSKPRAARRATDARTRGQARRARHRAADVLRLALASAVLIAAGLLSFLASAHVRETERRLLEAIVTIPASLRDALNAVAQTVLIVLPIGIAVFAIARRRFGLLGRLAFTAVLATGAAFVVSQLMLQDARPTDWHALVSGRGGAFDVTFPPVTWMCGTTAMLTVAAPELSRRWRTALWWLLGTAAAVEVFVGAFLPLDVVVAISLGVATGSAALIAFGSAASEPTPDDVSDALRQCGIDVSALEEQAPARGDPSVYRATTHDGSALTVQVLVEDDEDRGRLMRLVRWLLLRNPRNETVGMNVESAAEHELLAMVTAHRGGARVPEAVIAYPIESHHGPRGALAAWAAVDGARMDELRRDDITDVTLHDLWSSVAQLREHRLAHRTLRTEHVVVDHDGHAWLTGFALAELGAADALLDTDVAELLASLAIQVGTTRAVASAIDGLGAPAVAAAASYLQPLALLGVTGRKVVEFDRARRPELTGRDAWRTLRPGERPELLRELREAVAEATATPSVTLAPLSRLTWKSLLGLLGAFVLIHLIVPQLANAPAAVDALRHADWWWVAAALPASFAAQGFATLLQLGTIPARLPFWPTYLVQWGGSFLNKVTPANAGGMALNVRYLQKAGVDGGAAAGSIGLQSIANTVGMCALFALFAAATKRSTSVHFALHGQSRVLMLIAVALGACALFALTPRGRRFLHDRVWTFLRSAGATIAEVATSPGHVIAFIVGALGAPIVQIIALAMCIHAVGGHVPFVQVGAIYLGARLLAGAAPVPGGLGALETAMIASFSALGMPIGVAASGVLIYRLVTYWVPLPIGWVALEMAQHRSYV